MLAISGSLKPMHFGTPLLVYGPARYGPRYGIIVGGAGPRAIPQLNNEVLRCADVQIFINHATDQEMAQRIESWAHRNTILSVPLFDPLRDDERSELLSAFYHNWFAEFYSPEVARIPG